MKTIKLKPNGVGRYDDVSPFMITDNQLQLKIELPAVNGEFYFIMENCETKRIPADGVLTYDNLTGGEIRAEVKHYLKGELIKTYHVEPLLLKEVDGSLTAEPRFAELTRRVEELEKAVEEIKYAEKLRDEWAKSMEGKIKALCLFAFTDYRHNVYLGGKGLDEFAKEFGFEFTEEEKELLKGEDHED